MTQYAQEPVEECGLLKLDILGLQTLTVLKTAVELVRKEQGVEIDLANLPLEDRKTYELINRGDTEKVFQLESAEIRRLILEVGVNNIEDLIAVIALDHPGTSEMLPSYVARKTGKEPVTYDHPLTEEDTFFATILRDGETVYEDER